jgi:group I intron endonuclease
MEPETGIIYKATNKITGKIYIGKTGRELPIRIMEHACHSKYGSRYYFHKSIRKYGIEAFVFEVVESGIPEEVLGRKEIEWIERLDCAAPKGYNLTLGGEGGKPIPEILEKIVKANRGKKRSKEHCERMSKIKKGQLVSMETRKKISESNKGRVVSELTRRKIGESQAGPKNHRWGKSSGESQRLAASAATKARWEDPVKRAACIEKLKAHRFSEEHKKHLSEAQQRQENWSERCKLAWIRRKIKYASNRAS